MSIEEYIEKAISNRDRCLDLSRCSLLKIPDAVYKMDWLEELVLGNAREHHYSKERNHIDYLPPKIGALNKLKRLDLSDNMLTDISSLQDLTTLQSLVLSLNEIRDIKSLQHLHNLSALYLGGNGVYDFTSLKKLGNLQILNLADSGISKIDFVENLTNLNTLLLSRNGITNIRPLKQLHSLRNLYLGENKISSVEHLSDLKNLTDLDLSGNSIVDISTLEHINRISRLSLSSNKITSIQALRSLTNLEYLLLSNNTINDINPLANLEKLIQLDLSHNIISDITPIKHLFFKSLPVKKSAAGGHGVSLENNPLAIPPIEIIEQGTAAILRYFKEIEKGTHIINEARVLIVGQGGAGKTSLRKKLTDVNADMPAAGDATKGIEIDTLPARKDNQEYMLHLWDFGGQNIQHYAHQFFLSDSSLYILLNNEREQNANFQYWLSIIEMLGEKSPIIIVQNETAGLSEPIKNMASIRARFENVISPVHAVNIAKAATDGRFTALKGDIVHHALKLPHVGKQYPISYLKVRDRLNNEISSGRHFIHWGEYVTICIGADVIDKSLMSDIAKTFSILGICLYFDEDIELKNYLFLNPKWIIDALFQLLYHEKVIKQKGQFAERDTEEIWHEPVYAGMHSKLLRMMVNFELCYPIKDSPGRYIVPQRLPVAEDSYQWNETDTTLVEYQYKFMPKGIITRITCRLHEKILDNHVWNDAVVFQWRDAKVFVREVYSEEKIAIEASGLRRKELLNRVVDEIDDIHEKTRYANLQVDKMVPCPCEVCSRSNTPFFFKFDLLIQLVDDGEFEERCGISRKKIKITNILRSSEVNHKGTELLSTNLEAIEPKQPLKVFISYSSKDSPFKEELLKHLSPLARTSKIVTWNDRNLIPGENWDEKIEKELSQADIILVLISANSINTDYIWHKEIKLAYDRANRNEPVAVIPIILDFCRWENLPFAENNVLPTKGEPITGNWKNPNEAWRDVIIGIEKSIMNLVQYKPGP